MVSYALPVVQVSVCLYALCGEVDGVAAEEEVVYGRDGESVAHEDGRVANQGCRHWARDTVDSRFVSAHVHFPSSFPVMSLLILSQCAGLTRSVLEGEGGAHISGSFCVSMTAAMGIPKLEAGPQKSVFQSRPLVSVSFHDHMPIPVAVFESASVCILSDLAAVRRYAGLTSRAEVIRDRVGPDFGIEGFDCGGHCDGNDYCDMER